MEFSTKNIQEIIDKHTFFENNEKNRKNAFDELNKTFFPDKICEFIDYSKDENDYISLMIEYKNVRYNILAYKEDILKKVERFRKIQKICSK